MAAREAQEKFSAMFRTELARAAGAAGLAFNLDGNALWVEEEGTYPAGSRGWWVTAGFKPQYRPGGTGLGGRQPDEYLPESAWPAYVTVAYSSGDGLESAAALLDVEVTGAGAHLAASLASMAVATIRAWLSDRDSRIELLREQKSRLALELERVSTELFQLDGIAD
jgi:hypothetical protein